MYIPFSNRDPNGIARCVECDAKVRSSVKILEAMMDGQPVLCRECVGVVAQDTGGHVLHERCAEAEQARAGKPTKHRSN
jgi:hypothetical protein